MKSFLLEKTVPVKFITVVNNTLLMSDYDLSFTMVTEFVPNRMEYNEAQKLQNISFTKVVTFITDILDGSVVFDAGLDDDIISKFYEFNNNFVTLPFIDESTLMAALHCKLNAIVDENTHIDRIKLLEKTENICYEYVSIDEEYTELPSEEEWNTEFSYWKGCWWNRPDVNTMDRNAKDKKEYDDWMRLVKENNLEKLYTQLFEDIEKVFANIDGSAGEVIEVDFEKSDVSHGKHIWKPVLVD